MVAVEGAATIPGDKSWPTEKDRPRPALPGARQSRKPPGPEAVNDPARVITTEHVFRSLLRPARLLRTLRTPAARSFAALLFAHVPRGAGARPATGAAVETGPRFNPEILIRWRRWPYIQPV
jgi:hypothetical protein